MTEQELIKIVQEHQANFNAGDFSCYKENLTPDAVYEEMATQRRIQGVDETVEALRKWREAFPDLKSTVNNMTVGGNTVVVELTWTGTQTGPLAGPLGTIPPSGKTGSTRAVVIYEFEGDKIKATRHYFDLMTILAQIGALPVPAAAAR